MMRFLYLINLLSLMVASVGVRAQSAGAVPGEFVVPEPSKVLISVDVRAPLEPVNRRVMGVCLIYPPFDGGFIESLKPVLDGVSGRAWAGVARVGQEKEKWMDAFRLARGVGLRELNAFNPNDHINRPARYASAVDNNLDPHHQPEEVAKFIKQLQTEPLTGLPQGAGITGWEVWNEPQFPQNGSWPAEDFARYILDVSRAVKKAGLFVEIGAPLHEDNMDWNRRMLGYVANEDPGAIQFVLTHPYDFSWIRTRARMGEYYARVAVAEHLRVRRLNPKQAVVSEVGNGRWRVVASEWNIHPEGFTPPFNVSTDMVAAIHVAAMFGVFWEENVDSAQYFELKGFKEGHFHLFTPVEKGLRVNPTGEVFRLYGEKFRGQRLETKVESAVFQHFYEKKEVPVPLVFSQTCYDAANGQVVIMVGNRHRDKVAPVEIRLSSFKPSQSTLTKITITGREPDLTAAEVTEDAAVPLPTESDPRVSVTVPPHSVTALIIKGTIPPTEAELFSGRQKFIRSWRVGAIVDPAEKSKHGLEVAPTAQELTMGAAIEASSTGFVNIGELLRVSGRGYNLREGFRATTRTWVFSPVDKETSISVGVDYWTSVRVNNKEVLSVLDRGGVAAPDTHRTKIRLNAGWNEISLRVASGSTGMGFWFAIEDMGDLLYSTDDKGLTWPKIFGISASEGAGVNSWDKAKDVPDADGAKLTLAGQGNIRKAYLKWPAIRLPAGKKLVKAEIVLTPSFRQGSDKSSVAISPVNASWDEKTLTYANQPARSALLKERVLVTEAAWKFSGEEVMTLVKQWIADPGKNFGICVESNITQYTAFFSDNNLENTPKLVLELE